MSEPRNPFEDIRSATVLKPGDRVLVDIGRSATQAEVARLAEQVKERLPDIEFTFLAGVESVYVAPQYRGGTDG